MLSEGKVDSDYADRPLVLILEDNGASLKLRKTLFQSADCDAVGVQTIDAAIRELRSSPGFDLFIADINLNIAQPDDKSGIEFARYAKRVMGDVPIVGYSAFFADAPDALTTSEIKTFDKYYDRPVGSAAIRQMVAETASLAREHRNSRKVRTEEALKLGSGNFAESRFEVLRHLFLDVESGADVEEVLREAGFRLKVVHPGIDPCVVEPVLVWLRGPTSSQSPGVEAEVYGHPSLYAHGDSDEDAISRLLQLMRLFAEHAKANSGLEGPARRLAEFLAHAIRS